MICPKCGFIKLRTKETVPYQSVIIRVRKCGKCGKTIKTYELLESEFMEKILDFVSQALRKSPHEKEEVQVSGVPKVR